MKQIAQRELRNDISRIMREVQAGERFVVTVAGRKKGGSPCPRRRRPGSYCPANVGGQFSKVGGI